MLRGRSGRCSSASPRSDLLLKSPQILLRGAATELRIAPVDRLLARYPTPAVSVGLHDAGVHGKAFAAYQTLGHASAYDTLEHVSAYITLAESAVPVF